MRFFGKGGRADPGRGLQVGNRSGIIALLEADKSLALDRTYYYGHFVIFPL